MKKHLQTLAFGGAVLLSATANAQTPVGTMVNNFTLTDISGGTHDLFAYLDAGKTVVIDVSATWCGPCWSYHNTHALDDFYTAHGPTGANDAVVLWIEGDPSTTTPCIYGPSTSGCTGGSQGDWTSGGTVEYPIIDLATSASFTSSGLSIPYYPVMYVICPNRTVYKSGVAGSIGTLSLLNGYMGDCATAITGTNAALASYSGATEVCGPVDVKVRLQNMGTSTLTSCTIGGTVGSTTLTPFNWTGSLDTYEWEEVNLGTVTLTGTATANINITTSDASAADNTLSKSISYNLSPSIYITVQMVTDEYGSETTWNIKNGGGTTVASGGPYGDLTAAGTTTQPAVNLTLPTDCYTFTVNDAYGDGMNSGYGAGSYTVKYGTTTLVTGGTFTTSDVRKFATSSSTGVEEAALVSGVTVYPNPVNNIANVNVNLIDAADIIINVTNSVGQVLVSKKVDNAAAGANTVAIDFSAFESGVYNVVVNAGGQNLTTRVIK